MTDRSLCGAGLKLNRHDFLRWALASLGTAWVSAVQAQNPGDGMLRVGVLAHYKPFSFTEGSLQGFDVDVMKRLAAIMKLQLQIHPDGMANLQIKLQADEISVIGNQLLPTPENRRLFDFAKPYAANQLVCIQHEDDNRDFLSLDDLVGKKLGVLASTGVEEQAKGALGKSVLPFPVIDQALKQLAEKKLDAVLEESLIADYYIERDGLPIKITAPFAPPMASGLAVRKGNKDMAARMTAAIQTMLSDGSFKDISNRWFGYDVSRPNVSHSKPR
jgi:cystine transport system substrate-binding protein